MIVALIALLSGFIVGIAFVVWCVVYKIEDPCAHCKENCE